MHMFYLKFTVSKVIIFKIYFLIIIKMDDNTLYISSLNSSNIITFQSDSSNTILKLANFKIHSENKSLTIIQNEKLVIMNNETITFNTNIIPMNNIDLGYSNIFIYSSNIIIQNENLFVKLNNYLTKRFIVPNVPKVPLNHNLFLSNQTFEVSIPDIYDGLIQTNYIIANPYNNAVLKNNILYIKSAKLANQSNYIISIGASNIFGLNEYFIYVLDYKNSPPIPINNITNYNLEYSFTSNIFELFSGLIEYYSITINPFDTANIENNVLQIIGNPDTSNAYEVEVFCSNVYGNNFWKIKIIDWKHSPPILNTDNLSNNSIITNSYSDVKEYSKL